MGGIFGGGGGNQQPFGSQFDPNNPAGGGQFDPNNPDFAPPDQGFSPDQADPNAANDWTSNTGFTQSGGSWPGQDNPVYASQAQADLSPPSQAHGSQTGQTRSSDLSSLADQIKNLIVPSAEASTLRYKQPPDASTSPGWFQAQTTPPWAGASQTPAPIEQDPAAGGHATDIFQQFRNMLFGKQPGPAPQPPPPTETGTGTPAPGTPIPQSRPTPGRDLGRPTPIPQPRPGAPGQDLGLPLPQPRPTPGQDLGTPEVPKVAGGGTAAGDGTTETPPAAGDGTSGGAGTEGGAPNLMSGPFNPLRLIVDLLSGNMGDLMRWFQGQPFQGKGGTPFGQIGKQPVPQDKPPADTVSPQSAPDSGKTTPPSMTLPWPGGPARGDSPITASADPASFASRFNAVASRPGTQVPMLAQDFTQSPIGALARPQSSPGVQTGPQTGGIPAPRAGQQLTFNDPFVRQMAQIESGNNRHNQTGNNYGLFQFSPDQFRHLGITNPYDPAQQIRALQTETTENIARARRVLGRDPTGAELYMMHQQGGAALPLIRAAQENPNAPAWQVAAPAYRNYRNPAGVAMSAISQRGFVPRTLGKPVEQVTAKDFVQLWSDRFNRTSQPRTRPGMTADMRQRLQGQARTTAYEGQQGLDRARQQEFPQRISARGPGIPQARPAERRFQGPIDSPNIRELRDPDVIHDFGPASDAVYMEDWAPLLNTDVRKQRSDTFEDRFRGERP